MLQLRDLIVALTSAVVTLLAANTVQKQGLQLTTTGRAKATGDKAFVLSVGLQFQDSPSAEGLLKAWEAAAQYCLKNEPFLYAYEVAQSDQGASQLPQPLIIFLALAFSLLLHAAPHNM